MPLIPTLGRQRQVDLCEFKASQAPKLHRETLSPKNKVKQNKTRYLMPSLDLHTLVPTYMETHRVMRRLRLGSGGGKGLKGSMESL